MKNKITNIFKGLSIIKFILLTLAGIINAVGITIFLSPVKLYDSGVSGTSMLLAQITPEYLTLSIFLIIINIPLFLYGLKKQGAIFTIYAIYSVCIYSLTAWLITDVLPIDVNLASPLAGTDLLLCALFGQCSQLRLPCRASVLQDQELLRVRLGRISRFDALRLLFLAICSLCVAAT